MRANVLQPFVHSGNDLLVSIIASSDSVLAENYPGAHCTEQSSKPRSRVVVPFLLRWYIMHESPRQLRHIDSFWELGPPFENRSCFTVGKPSVQTNQSDRFLKPRSPRFWFLFFSDVQHFILGIKQLGNGFFELCEIVFYQTWFDIDFFSHHAHKRQVFVHFS